MSTLGSGLNNLNYYIKRSLVTPSKRDTPHPLVVRAFLRARFVPKYYASYESYESLTPKFKLVIDTSLDCRYLTADNKWLFSAAKLT